MRTDTARCLVRGICIPVMLIAAVSLPVGGPASAQGSAKVVCEQAFDACSDACVHLGVITARCFNQCKRRYQVCSIRRSILPNAFRSKPAATQVPTQSSVDRIQ